MQYINAGYSYALVVLKYFPSFKLLFFRIVFIHLSRTIRCIYFRQNFLVFFVNFESFLMISHDVCVYLWLAVISSTSFLCCLLLFLFSFFFFSFLFFISSLFYLILYPLIFWEIPTYIVVTWYLIAVSCCRIGFHRLSSVLKHLIIYFR